jgi:ABC-2 type transport system permease protein
MLHLLQLEWLKQKHNRTFLVLIGMYALLLPTLILSTKTMPDFPPPINSSDTFFQFPDVFIYLGYSGNWLVFFFLGFFSVVFITAEFGYRTFRQNIINGLSRTELFLSKFQFLLALALFATLYYGIWCMIYGYTHTETIYTSVILKNIDYLPRYFLMCVSYMSFGMFLGILLRRTGIALFLYFSYVMFIEVILRWVIHYRITEDRTVHFYPMNATEDLVPFPMIEQADNFGREIDFNILLSPNEAIMTTAVYVFIFLALSYWMVLKRDL